ncbi:hypothetical protein D3C72_1499330 [compost metagenome]
MIALECVVHFVAAAIDKAALEVPGRVRYAGDVVVLIAFAGGVVDHHVTIFAPPLHAVFKVHVVLGQHLAANQGAMRNPAAVQRSFHTEQLFANSGVDAIGADDNIDLCGAAVAEVQAHQFIGFLDPGQALVEVHSARRNGRHLQCMQVPAVHGDVSRAVFLASEFTQGDAGQIVTAGTVAAEPEVGVRTHVAQLLFNAHAAEDFHDVGPHVDTRTNTGKLWRLFINIDLEPGFL